MFVGGTSQSAHPRRQQQSAGLQAEAINELCLALFASGELRGSRDQIPRPLVALAHHRQVRHTPENRTAGVPFVVESSPGRC